MQSQYGFGKKVLGVWAKGQPLRLGRRHQVSSILTIPIVEKLARVVSVAVNALLLHSKDRGFESLTTHISIYQKVSQLMKTQSGIYLIGDGHIPTMRKRNLLP